METEGTETATTPQTYLFRFVQRFEEFRMPEVESLAQMFGVRLEYNPEEAKLVSSLVEKRPFLKVKLESDEAAATLAKRAISLQYYPSPPSPPQPTNIFFFFCHIYIALFLLIK